MGHEVLPKAPYQSIPDFYAAEPSNQADFFAWYTQTKLQLSEAISPQARPP